MFLRNKSFFSAIRILVLGAPLFLAGCHSDFGPFPMPAGYKYLDRVHKTPPGPEPVLKKIKTSGFSEKDKICADPRKTASKPDGSEQAEMLSPRHAAPGQWDYAANDLLGKLRAAFGMPSESVYIETPVNSSPDDADFERSLRAAAPENGFMLAAAPGMGPFTLSYSMTPAPQGNGPRMIVTLTLESAGRTVSQASGIYESGFSSPMREMPAPHQYGGDPSTMPGTPLSISPSR